MRLTISLVLATFITLGLGFGLNHVVIKTHNLEQLNE